MKHWPTMRLGELAEVFNGKTPARSEQRSAGHPVLKIKDVDENGTFRGHFESFVDYSFVDANTRKRANAGDVLILNAAHNSDYVASKIFYADKQVSGAIATGEWTIIRPNPAAILSKFIHFWVQSRIGLTSIKNLVRGIHLYPSDVASVRLAVPPLAEQERIVKLLDEADELRKLRAQADRHTATLIPALFHEMFGDPVSNPVNWPLHRLSDICEGKAGIKAGPFGSSLKKDCYTPAGPRVYGQEQVIADDFSIGDYHISEGKFIEMEAYAVSPGDLLISLVGTIGKVAIAPDKIERGVINPRLLRVRPRKDMLHPCYLAHVLTAPSSAKHFGGVATGMTMGVLNAGLLKRLTVPIPPLSLQKEFAQRVTEIRVLETTQATSRTRLDALFQSTLHHAFNGQI